MQSDTFAIWPAFGQGRKKLREFSRTKKIKQERTTIYAMRKPLAFWTQCNFWASGKDSQLCRETPQLAGLHLGKGERNLWNFQEKKKIKQERTTNYAMRKHLACWTQGNFLEWKAAASGKDSQLCRETPQLAGLHSESARTRFKEFCHFSKLRQTSIGFLSQLSEPP